MHAEPLIAVARHTDPVIARVLCVSIRDYQAVEIERALGALVEGSGGRLVVAMGRVDQLTSAGINALLRVQAMCDERGGRLVLCGVKPDLRRLLRVTRLEKMLPIAAHEAAAVTLFGRAQSAKKRRRMLLPDRAA